MNAPVENISKFLEGTLDANDTDALVQWRKATPENEKHFQELAYVWNSSEQAITQQNEELKIDTEAALAKVNSKIDSATVVQLKPRFNLLAIASSIALLIGALFTFQYLNKSEQLIEIIASGSTGQEVTLPDASTIWLEPEATLSYLASFTSGRQINIEGEVFLNVERNEDLPFIVTSPNLEVQVLGTSFVVNDSSDKTSSHVTVLSGKVRVSASKSKKDLILTKDMTAVYQKESTDLSIAEKARSTNHLYAAIKKLRFTNITLGDLIAQLETLTKNKIELKNQALFNCPFTGQFETNNIDKILQIIQPIYNFTVQSNANQYTVTGGSCN